MIEFNSGLTNIYELTRSNLLELIDNNEILSSRSHCRRFIQHFELWPHEKQNYYIAVEVMRWIPNSPDIGYFATQDKFVSMHSFKPSECIFSAFSVYEHILIENRTSLIPCTNKGGRCWALKFDDLVIETSKTAEMAICKSSIIINYILRTKCA
ncbi:BC1872 family protein [Paenibacillus suaedae]|uniref:BC1872 family protein n=1 Tax=Paenibacillus suaedae TaxID=3077233 RepID=UPI0037426B52